MHFFKRVAAKFKKKSLGSIGEGAEGENGENGEEEENSDDTDDEDEIRRRKGKTQLLVFSS